MNCMVREPFFILLYFEVISSMKFCLSAIYAKT